MAVAVEIRHTTQSPTCWKSGTEHAANKNVVVKIPDRCLTGGGVLNHKVWVAVAVKVGHCRPGRWLERWKRWLESQRHRSYPRLKVRGNGGEDASQAAWGEFIDVTRT